MCKKLNVIVTDVKRDIVYKTNVTNLTNVTHTDSFMKMAKHGAYVKKIQPVFMPTSEKKTKLKTICVKMKYNLTLNITLSLLSCDN